MGAAIHKASRLLAAALCIATAPAWADAFDYVAKAGEVGGNLSLPDGWGPMLLVFFRIVGIAVVLRGVILQYDVASMMGGSTTTVHPASQRAPLVHYLTGVLIYHIDYVLAVLSNTLPFLPDLGNIFF